MTETQGLKTHIDCQREGTRRLRAAGIDAAGLEARLLLMAATGLTRTGLIAAGQDRMEADAVGRFDAMLRERLTRRPLQHIVGTTEFFGLEFVCDGRALIPRADSEVVVEAALDRLAADSSCLIADLGTGSGCLLAAILVNRGNARGVGVEASPAAASLARENFERLGLSARTDVFEGSWRDWADWAAADLIISNPPYIASGEIPSLAPEVRGHDPLAALDGGVDGLRAYREIIALASERMKPGAWIVFEIGHDQKDAVSGWLQAADFTEIGTCRDLGGNDRAVWARKRES